MKLDEGFYTSPRWSWEILDCSMPMTFDTYSNCAHQCVYCTPEESLILGADLCYKWRGDIQVGDTVLGFLRDEQPRIRTKENSFIKNGRQRWQPATVLAVGRRKASLVKVHFNSGRSVVCTPDHRWYLRSEKRSTFSYLTAKVGRLGGYIPLPQQHHMPISDNYRMGYIYGLFDGDGNRYENTVTISMCDVEAIERLELYLKSFGMRFTRDVQSPNNQRPLARIRLSGKDQMPFFEKEYQDNSEFWRGWLAGMIDAEGNSPQFGIRTNALTISQYESVNPEIHKNIQEALKRFNFSFVANQKEIRLQGGIWEQARLAQFTQPSIPRKSTGGLLENTLCVEHDQIVAVESFGEGEVVSIATSTGNYVADSYASRNCFAYFQRAVHPTASQAYLHHKVKVVDIDNVKSLFRLEPEALKKEKNRQFEWYIKNRYVLQWGGMSDGFDWYEQKFRKSLELLRFFVDIGYPVSISTKGTWFLDDPEYLEVIERGRETIHFKFSIITTNEDHVKALEAGVSSTTERFEAIRKLRQLGIYATTRFRPFIIGTSDVCVEEIFQRSKEVDANSITTEFLCIEGRAKESHRQRYQIISDIVGYDVFEFYKRHSIRGGLMRLNYDIKRPYMIKMRQLAKQYDIPFFVSDAHHKECSEHSGCCGLPTEGALSNKYAGHFAEAIKIAQRNGKVFWSDIAGLAEELKNIPYANAQGFNQGTTFGRAKYRYHTMFDFMRDMWNDITSFNSPARYFGGALVPGGKDEYGDVIYIYNKPFIEEGVHISVADLMGGS